VAKQINVRITMGTTNISAVNPILNAKPSSHDLDEYQIIGSATNTDIKISKQ